MKETTQNNILLAEFLGVKEKESNWFDGYELQEAGLPFNYGAMGNGTRDLKFHTSWDWLMLVVDKIEGLILGENNSINVTIGATNYCVIQDSNGEIYNDNEESKETKLKTVYAACVKFVKWYNENKSK